MVNPSPIPADPATTVIRIGSARDAEILLDALSRHPQATGLVMLSPLAAGPSLGPLWWAALLTRLPQRPAQDRLLPVLDCGPTTALAAQALAQGLPAVAVDPGPQLASLQAFARSQEAFVFVDPHVDLDLTVRGARTRLEPLLSAAGRANP